MTKREEAKSPRSFKLKMMLAYTSLCFFAFLSSCVPATQGDGYRYGTDIETLYTAVEFALQELAETGIDDVGINITEFDAYTTLVAGFGSTQGPVNVPLTVDGVSGGSVPLYPRYGGEITATFTSTANDETQVNFSIRDPNRPLRDSEGSFYQMRVRDNGRPFVEEIIRRLNSQFIRL